MVNHDHCWLVNYPRTESHMRKSTILPLLKKTFGTIKKINQTTNQLSMIVLKFIVLLVIPSDSWNSWPRNAAWLVVSKPLKKNSTNHPNWGKSTCLKPPTRCVQLRQSTLRHTTLYELHHGLSPELSHTTCSKFQASANGSSVHWLTMIHCNKSCSSDRMRD